MKMFRSLGSIAFFGATPCLTTSDQDLMHMHGRCHVVDNHTKAPLIIATTMSKARPKEIEMEGGALEKVEGG